MPLLCITLDSFTLSLLQLIRLSNRGTEVYYRITGRYSISKYVIADEQLFTTGTELIIITLYLIIFIHQKDRKTHKISSNENNLNYKECITY